MIITHIKMAVRTIRSARIRSLLTILGIVIGVSSILLTIALAQGIRTTTIKELNKLGDTFITVQPGTSKESASFEQLRQLNISGLLVPNVEAGTLSPKDAEAVSQVPNIAYSAPVMLLNGTLANGNRKLPDATVIATGPEFPIVLDKEVESGAFFANNETNKSFAVLGHAAAHKLFGEDAPLGSTITIRGQEFVVIGIMKAERDNNVRIGPGFDDGVFISVPKGKALNNGDARFQFIYASASSAQQTHAVAGDIKNALKTTHAGEDDVTVLTRADAIAISNREAKLIGSIAIIIMSISLLVAGVGIMNIMLMLVTERTREIGIRKAIGATNRQIASQFFAEALVLSSLGGLIGLILSGLVVIAVDAYTDVHLSFSWQMAALGLGVPIVIGCVFGLLPALKAARKDPIQALRNE